MPMTAEEIQTLKDLMNREDMDRLSLQDEDLVTIDSGHGKIEAIVEGSDRLARDTIGLAQQSAFPVNVYPLQESQLG